MSEKIYVAGLFCGGMAPNGPAGLPPGSVGVCLQTLCV